MEILLEYLIYGKPIINQQIQPQNEVLGLSSGLETLDPTSLQTLINLIAPISDDPTLALICTNPKRTMGQASFYWWIRAESSSLYPHALSYQFIQLPATLLDRLAGNLTPLHDLIASPLPVYTATHIPLKPLTLPHEVIAWSDEARNQHLQDVLSRIFHDDIQRLLALLAATLHPEGVIITGFDGNSLACLHIAQALMACLPSLARPLLTFTTRSQHVPPHEPRLIFTNTNPTSTDIQRPSFDWQSAWDTTTLITSHPYTAYLASIWQQDLNAWLVQLQDIESLALLMLSGQSLQSGLASLAWRLQLDQAVQSQTFVETADLLAVLDSGHLQDETLHETYLTQLLNNALNERDKLAGERIAAFLEHQTSLDEVLAPTFFNALDVQPDAVYAFVRERLSEKFDEKWLPLLHTAAQRSLSVALSSGDTPTLIGWLRLISREPVRYELLALLSDALRQAHTRALNDAELARELLTLAVKRDPQTLALFVADDHLLHALDAPLQAALVAHDSAAIEALAETTRELFLLALVQASTYDQARLTPNLIRILWELSQTANMVLAEPYRPRRVIVTIAQRADGCLTPGALEMLLTLILAHHDDDLFFEIMPAISAVEGMIGVLSYAMLKSGRAPEELVKLGNQLLQSQVLRPQHILDVYTTLLQEQNWHPTATPLIEQVARLLNQYADTESSLGVFWRILEAAAEARSDQMGRGVTKRLLHEMGHMALESQLLETLTRLKKLTAWSQTLTAMLMTWWRDFTATQSLGQLQKLERAIEPIKGLEALRNVVQTSLAFRRMIGQRTMGEFAQLVSNVYTLLQAMSDGFDPQSKTPIAIDLPTLRSFLHLRALELSPEERHVLATNFKDLADLVVTMADHRSKPSLMRSDDVLDRQLASGEVPPQSAVDLLKWLSGYLDGGHQTDGTD